MGLPCKPALGVLLKGSAVVLIHPTAEPLFQPLRFGVDVLQYAAFWHLPGHIDGSALHPLLTSGAVPVADGDLEFPIAPLLN